LVVIGVHTPEFSFEYEIDRVRQAMTEREIDHPVVVDNDYKSWSAFDNHYWPALYFVDADGIIRDHHLDVVSFGESAVADEGAGDAGEGQEVLGFPFVPAVEAAAASEPGHGAFDGPAVPAQTLRRLDPFACDAVGDSSRAEPSPQVVVVVTLVGVQLGGAASAWPTAGADRRYATDERFESLAVMQVRPRDADREGQTGPLGDQVDLRALCLCLQDSDLSGPPFQGPHVHGVDRTTGPVPFAACTQFVQYQSVELGPHPGLAPLSESPVSRRPRRSERRRQLPPCASRRGHEDDRGQNLAVSVPPPTTTLRPGRSRRHHPLEQLPQLIRHQTFNDPHDGRLSNMPNETTSKSS
jgi:hypothetical protein